ncbi:LLM class flavin-dependent oxidoreductase [Actinomycetospora termitidis]|uniref:LLM class flavin-dependent oxidoreductase n=1 Tax=Actinomycetospora termitidis TaxID=3053470 RepID=A0ABT7M749_9PSEU|nr:LLM class flavin-dependent oxidoreductase [Actinomycetospora sp. Odt1-22]MDL5155627.1 LLM class flavin-dependent oxidoreductase [Actinomycetospora sp. Odt1-22]
MELGIFTFADVVADPVTGDAPTPARRLRDVVDLAVLADDGGLEVFGVGEHHRRDFAVTSPAVVLGAVATRTRRLRLTSAVTVLSSADPVRVFEDFTTVDLLSDGRAEILAGRGAFIESFPLYGADPADYEALFDEKIDLLLRLTRDETVTWSGRFRPALDHQPVFPRPVQPRLPVGVGVGGSPASFLRAGRLGLPITIGIVGGRPEALAPHVVDYRAAAERAGHDAAALPVALTAHAFVARTSQEAGDVFYPRYAAMAELAGRSLSREQFDRARGLDGHLVVGSPAEVTEKLLHQQEIFGHQRFLAQIPHGPLPHKDAMRAVELLGADVAPHLAP